MLQTAQRQQTAATEMLKTITAVAVIALVCQHGKPAMNQYDRYYYDYYLHHYQLSISDRAHLLQLPCLLHSAIKTELSEKRKA